MYIVLNYWIICKLRHGAHTCLDAGQKHIKIIAQRRVPVYWHQSRASNGNHNSAIAYEHYCSNKTIATAATSIINHFKRREPRINANVNLPERTRDSVGPRDVRGLKKSRGPRPSAHNTSGGKTSFDHATGGAVELDHRKEVRHSTMIANEFQAREWSLQRILRT